MYLATFRERYFAVTASDSSSSAIGRTDRSSLDLLEAGLLPPLPAALIGGRDLDLLEPLRLVGGGELPETGAAVVDRQELAAGLATANAAYGHPAATTLAQRLADPETRVVVTGQQPGLLGGPLYTLSKAVAAALWAERLEEAGTPAVALFWVATEDHDFREVSRAVFLAPGGPRTFTLGEDPEPLLPVGMRSLGEEVASVLNDLREAMPGERFAEWVETLGRWYRPEARFGEAFCRLLAHLLGERCPLLVDAMLPAVKAAERPWLEQLVAKRHEVDRALAEINNRIEGRGYQLQVKPQPGASPLFLLHSRARRRIEWMAEDRMVLRGCHDVDEPVSWLETTIEENPGVVSPGVQARPLIQDAILGTSLQVLGPGELSYMPQVAPLYDLLGVRAPAIALRPQILVLEDHQWEKLDGTGLGLGQLLSSKLDLDRLLSAGAGEDLLAPVRSQLEGPMSELREAALEIDPGLQGPWEKTQGQMERALGVFEAKISAAAARRDEVTRQRVEKLRNLCRPLGSPQERVVSTSQFPGKYGDSFAAALFEQLRLDGGNLQVISP
ncbi:MAG: bacillithiol biosynthesis cysteine-adding enzyme BshC [Acidobacteria bacterium]|nr:MAG: bacillithiol biosynthesis cysteine-adding enzyme BshC [Acidobacteriota bacterium]